MRIGIFTDTYPPFINGVSTSIASLEKALINEGHEVFIVTVNPENMSYKLEDNDRIIRIPGIPIGIYDYRLTGIYPIKAINKIKNWNLDIIHSHTEFGIGTFARIIAKQYDIPLVHTYHTMYEDYTHYITHGHFDKSSKLVVEHLTKFYCDRTAKELIVPSKKTYNLFKEKYKLDKNIHIVPTGLEVERFYKENNDILEVNKVKKDLGLKREDFVILYVGRLAKEKNIELLLEAQLDLIKANKNCKLVIIGSGPDYAHFIDISVKKGLTKNIIFTNSIPWDIIPYYYQVADIFATASKTETQGLTLVEAMAASKPVICYDDEAFNEIVIDDVNGRMFKTKDEYVNIVKEIMKDSGKLKNMSLNARITAENHDLKHYALSILDVYNECLIKCRSDKKWYDKLKDIIGKNNDN